MRRLRSRRVGAYEGKLPPIARMGAILAGDLYSVPEANKRGGYGDVADVWSAFASRFAWVAGVAGNHDDVSSVPSIGDNVYLLDGVALAEYTARLSEARLFIRFDSDKRRTESAHVRCLTRERVLRVLDLV